MLKKTITYKDYNDVERTEDFYFNLSRVEVTEMDLSVPGGYVAMIQKIVAEMDGDKIMKVFKDFILKSYGEKSADGRFFDKGEAISSKFLHSPAYDVLFMELMTEAGKAHEFMNAIIPNVEEPKK